jgi:hypothetical protein
MKGWSTRKHVIVGLVSVVTLLILGGIIVVVLFIGGQRLGSQEIRARQEQLLQRTDHHELLRACRKLMATRRSGPERPPGERALYLDPSSESVPEVIRRLSPMRVEVADDHVRLEMGGGLFHFGVDAFPEGVDPFPEPGSRRLIDGLRYYEEQ